MNNYYPNNFSASGQQWPSTNCQYYQNCNQMYPNQAQQFPAPMFNNNNGWQQCYPSPCIPGPAYGQMAQVCQQPFAPQPRFPMLYTAPPIQIRKQRPKHKKNLVLKSIEVLGLPSDDESEEESEEEAKEEPKQLKAIEMPKEGAAELTKWMKTMRSDDPRDVLQRQREVRRREERKRTIKETIDSMS